MANFSKVWGDLKPWLLCCIVAEKNAVDTADGKGPQPVKKPEEAVKDTYDVKVVGEQKAPAAVVLPAPAPSTADAEASSSAVPALA